MQAPKRGFTSTTLIDDPAREWQQALISGNGRMGAMVFGGVQVEREVAESVPDGELLLRAAQQLSAGGRVTRRGI